MVSTDLHLTSDAVHPGRSVLPLSIALSDNPRTRPVIEGACPFEGLRLIPTDGASLRNVLAPASIRRFRRLGDVDVHAHDPHIAGKSRLGRLADLHDAQILPQRDPGAAGMQASRNRRT